MKETEAEVIAVVSQRITAVYDEIYPRYNEVTSDGVKLDVDWWMNQYPQLSRTALSSAMQRRARDTGATNVERSDRDTGATIEEKGSIRSARSAIRRHPELAAELTKDPEVAHIIGKAAEKLNGPMNAIVAISELSSYFATAKMALQNVLQILQENDLDKETAEITSEHLTDIRLYVDGIEAALTAGDISIERFMDGVQ